MGMSLGLQATLAETLQRIQPDFTVKTVIARCLRHGRQIVEALRTLPDNDRHTLAR